MKERSIDNANIIISIDIISGSCIITFYGKGYETSPKRFSAGKTVSLAFIRLSQILIWRFKDNKSKIQFFGCKES